MHSRRLVLLGVTLLAFCSVATCTDLTNGLSFVAITPCRIIDTRNGQGFSGQFGPPALSFGATRTFQLTGTTTGTPTQCGIPDTAEAISANFTATGFTGPGDIRAFPAGGVLPNASILNYKLENISNTVTVPLGPSGSGHNGITVQADVSNTQMVVDVSGYYEAKNLAAFVAADGTFIRGIHSTGSSHLGAGFYEVDFSRDLTQCVWFATPGVSTFGGSIIGGAIVTTAGRAGNTSAIFINTLNPAAADTDFPFSVFVTCP